jgi:hypothetical protein
MAINFNELEEALHHIRVNHLCNCDSTKWRIQFSFRGEGETIIDVWDENDKWIGNFLLSDLTEELALLRAGKLDFCDLYANSAEDDEEN